jgi:predicted neuraminidase
MRRFLFLLHLLVFLYPPSSLKANFILKTEIISQNIADFDCHGPSLAETTDGILIAVWKGSPGKGYVNVNNKSDVAVWCSRCMNGVWTAPEKIVGGGNTPIWTPILCQLPSQETLLFYRSSPTPRQTIGLLMRSFDSGQSWSSPEILPAGISGPTRSAPLVNDQGTIICGSSEERGEATDVLKATACWIETSHDAGKTWKKFGPIEIPGRRFGAIEPILFHDAEGHLKMLCRDRANKVGEVGFIQAASSFDGGISWTALAATDLPNPDSGIDAKEIAPGKIVLAYNSDHVQRFPLSLAISNDGGSSWMKIADVETNSGEFPSLLTSSDGLLHVAYAWTPDGKQQRVIKHVVIDPQILFTNCLE